MAFDNILGSDTPQLIRPERDKIPQFLRALDHWITGSYGKGNGIPRSRNTPKSPCTRSGVSKSTRWPLKTT